MKINMMCSAKKRKRERELGITFTKVRLEMQLYTPQCESICEFLIHIRDWVESELIPGSV